MIPRHVFVLSGVLFVAPLAAAGTAADETAAASVVDGDTLALGGETIRLAGIDAPEKDQDCGYGRWRYHCGQVAAYALKELLGKHWVRCTGSARDTKNRRLAVCYIGPEDAPVDVNAEMVRLGWAMSTGAAPVRYRQHEAEAKKAARGLWQGEFEKPWEWRRAQSARR